VPEHSGVKLFLVAPYVREEDVCTQLAPPALTRGAEVKARFSPDGELEKNRDVMARFGAELKADEAVMRILI
jgi:type II restriction enzyme